MSVIREQKYGIMGQNYLKADLRTDWDNVHIPVTSSGNGRLSIYYDGQIGNIDDLASMCRISKGPFLEEQVLLHLYQQYGRQMFHYLDDAIFAFVISNGEDLFVARDVLGIKTLFYGWQEDTLYLASELKSLVAVTDNVYEFPPGHYMDSSGQIGCFGDLHTLLPAPETMKTDLNLMLAEIRDIIHRSIRNRVDFAQPTAGLLSGGMDSSVINYLASKLYKEKFGEQAQMKTFTLGVGESSDIQNARLMADYLETDHHEFIVSMDQVLAALPEVIYYLESFDPSLVRSAVSNFLISGHAKDQNIEVVLSGEGGDEIFCGYTYLRESCPDELPKRQVECLGFLHNNASLRLDRMNQCHSIQVIAPLISGELLRYSMSIPPEYKIKPFDHRKIEKWIFRKAFEHDLPEAITWRPKQEMSQGSGSADWLPAYFENAINDQEFAEAQARYPIIRSKEELCYFRMFTEHFGDTHAIETVGQWISL